MKRCKITAIRKTEYKDLMEKYENPMEHACDIEEGQVFITEGWKRPEGFCESAPKDAKAAGKVWMAGFNDNSITIQWTPQSLNGYRVDGYYLEKIGT